MDDFEKDTNLVLPFEEIFSPEVIYPNSDSLNSEDVVLLKSICWTKFENNVVEGIYKSILKFNSTFGTIPPITVYQMAICTSIQACGTSIDFETRDHALEHLQHRISIFRESGHTASSEENAKLLYNPNQADFKYWGFHNISHPELEPLRRLNLDDKALTNAAEEYIEMSLLRVVQRLLDENTLADLPQDEAIWVGISSPRSWYDHVQKLFFPHGCRRGTSS